VKELKRETTANFFSSCFIDSSFNRVSSWTYLFYPKSTFVILTLTQMKKCIEYFSFIM